MCVFFLFIFFVIRVSIISWEVREFRVRDCHLLCPDLLVLIQRVIHVGREVTQCEVAAVEAVDVDQS